jgi:hypothetical protein
MEINRADYLTKKEKAPPHEKAAIVNLFLDFVGGATKKYDYGYWLKKVGRCTYGDALDIIKSLEQLPIEYNKAGVIINKLKKLNGK